MNITIKVLDYLQDNPELLNKWYNNKITSEEVYNEYMRENKEYMHYLIGDDAVNVYQDGREDENGEDLTGIDAVLSADEENISGYKKFIVEVGVTSIHEFTEATGGEDHILISKKEYDLL